jgi:8-oxo-dGTP pyrophosphatase MutT (NUDIX family)
VQTEETSRGYKHWTVGALIEQDNAFLLLQKRQWPFLWDIPAGHLEVGEDPSEAVRREVREESGLELLEPRLIFHGEIVPDACRRGAIVHEWYVYSGQVTGTLHPSADEARDLRWVTRKEMMTLPFVRPAYVIFDTLNIWDTPLLRT